MTIVRPLFKPQSATTTTTSCPMPLYICPTTPSLPAPARLPLPTDVPITHAWCGCQNSREIHCDLELPRLHGSHCLCSLPPLWCGWGLRLLPHGSQDLPLLPLHHVHALRPMAYWQGTWCLPLGVAISQSMPFIRAHAVFTFTVMLAAITHTCCLHLYSDVSRNHTHMLSSPLQ
jgi:hypothetical protein